MRMGTGKVHWYSPEKFGSRTRVYQVDVKKGEERRMDREREMKGAWDSI